MFEETIFSDGDDDDAPSTSCSSSAAFSADAVRNAVVCKPQQMRLHTPRDAAFQLYAALRNNAAPMRDAGQHQGELWTTCLCRCLQCELIRVGSKLGSLLGPAAHHRPVGLILLDLDNFGLKEFSRREPTMEAVPSLSDAFVLWCFYGAYFSRHHGNNPEELPLIANANERSVWGRFIKANRCYFTPCGGHRQAVDEVVGAVCHAAAESYRRAHPAFLVMVVTGDKDLVSFCNAQGTDGVLAVDVNVMGKRVDRLWQWIENTAFCHSTKGLAEGTAALTKRKRVREKDDS